MNPAGFFTFYATTATTGGLDVPKALYGEDRATTSLKQNPVGLGRICGAVRPGHRLVCEAYTDFGEDPRGEASRVQDGAGSYDALAHAQTQGSRLDLCHLWDAGGRGPNGIKTLKLAIHRWPARVGQLVDMDDPCPWDDRGPGWRRITPSIARPSTKPRPWGIRSCWEDYPERMTYLPSRCAYDPRSDALLTAAAIRRGLDCRSVLVCCRVCRSQIEGRGERSTTRVGYGPRCTPRTGGQCSPPLREKKRKNLARVATEPREPRRRGSKSRCSYGPCRPQRTRDRSSGSTQQAMNATARRGRPCCTRFNRRPNDEAFSPALETGLPVCHWPPGGLRIGLIPGLYLSAPYEEVREARANMVARRDSRPLDRSSQDSPAVSRENRVQEARGCGSTVQNQPFTAVETVCGHTTHVFCSDGQSSLNHNPLFYYCIYAELRCTLIEGVQLLVLWAVVPGRSFFLTMPLFGSIMASAPYALRVTHGSPRRLRGHWEYLERSRIAANNRAGPFLARKKTAPLRWSRHSA